jgi:hypothetical protein
VRALFLRLTALSWFWLVAIPFAIGQNRGPYTPPGGESAGQDRGAVPPAVRPGRIIGEASKPNENPGVEVSPLDTIWMRDSKGILVPVVGIPFEEFEQLLRAKKGFSPASPPAYTLETMSLVGKADVRSADFSVTATIRVRDSGWVRVPLHLAGAIVRQPLQHEGPGEHFLSYDSDAEGYVCWLKGNDPRPHVITIALTLPISSAGQEKRLHMLLPRATESSLRLLVGSSAVDTSLVSGEGIAAARELENGSSEVAVIGPGGDVQLAWRPRHKPAGSPLQLDASGEISVRIHSEHRIATDARLRVRSYGPLLESFRVRLPPGMELISTAASSGYSLSVIDSEVSNSKSTLHSQQIVEVRLDKPAAATEVLLRAQREADAASAVWLSPAQFAVLGAVRQRGTVDFVMDGEWHLDWKEDKSVHRIELMPETAAARVVARYEYFQQPCGLAVKVSARPSRLSVEPIHRVYVEAERLRIETLLKYRFRGARAESLAFEMGDWEFDRLTPDGFLDFPLEEEADGAELRIPFRPGAAPPTELELKLEAHRNLPRGTDQLSFSFPRPRADIMAAATILVFAAENIELTPQYDQIEGLSPESLVPRSLEKDHPSLVFRDMGGEETARFVARLRMLKRSTNTAAKATVRIDRQQIQIEQHIEYQVAHEPQREFLFLAPRDIASSDSLDVVLNGQSVPLRQFAEQRPDDDRLILIHVTAPQPLLGSFQATIRYALPLVWDRKAAFSISLPLVVPADEGEALFTGQQVQFQLADGFKVEPEQADIEDELEPLAVRGMVNTFSWDRVASFSQWSLMPGRAALAANVRVSQMWVQTWLTPEIRHERVAVRISTAQDNLHLRLPHGVRSDSIQAAVDSEKVEPSKRRLERASPNSAPEITIPLKTRGQESVVELWYSLDPPPRWMGIGNGELRTVQIVDAEAPKRVYWQLVTPPGEHLISLPGELSSEMAWTSDRFHMFRRPILDQRQLESWMKASRQDLLPSTAHEYLFGAVARWPTLSVQTARSSVIVGLASAAVLLIGLGILYLPQLRRPEFLFAFAVGLAAASILWPDAAVLAGQAGALGLAILTLLSIWNYLTTTRPIGDIRPATTTASQSLPTSPTQSSGSRRERSSRLGTTHGAPLMEARP